VDSDADADLVKIHGLTWTEYLGIRTSLVTTHAPCQSLGGPNRVYGMYDVTTAKQQTVPSHPHACRAYISQSIASQSDASHCAQRPPTTSVSHATTACGQLDHRLIIGYGNSEIGYEIHTYLQQRLSVGSVNKTI